MLCNIPHIHDQSYSYFRIRHNKLIYDLNGEAKYIMCNCANMIRLNIVNSLKFIILYNSAYLDIVLLKFYFVYFYFFLKLSTLLLLSTILGKKKQLQETYNLDIIDALI